MRKFKRKFGYKHLMLVTVTILILFSCQKDRVDDCETCQKGMLRPGLDGCEWIIQLPDGKKLEPINLDDFNIELSENRQVCFQYHKTESQVTYCQIGTVIEIECIATDTIESNK